MDTKKDSAVSDVPTFKVARVGNDRKRKGAGFSFLRGGGSRGGWSGATGGAGAGAGAGGLGGAGGLAGALGMNFTQMMLAILVTSAIGSAAVYVGSRSASGAGSAAAKKSAIFSGRGDVKMEGDMSNLPSNANTIPNSLGYLSGSKDGLTPEERAKKEADAAAAAEAQRIADEEAAKKAEADALAGNPAVDPGALLASAQADGGGKGTAFGKKFGSLSSSLGGGSSLSGGAGLSGGVNRSFGSSGGIPKGTGGQMGAMKGGARPTTSRSARAALGKSNTKGFARRQLANANAQSRRASSAGKAENAAADAASAFDNNQGAGNVISGPGVGAGGSPSSGGGLSPNPGGGGGGGGGSIPSTPIDCGADMYQTADGNCALIPIEAGKDAKPLLTLLAKIAMGCLLLIGILAALVLMLQGTAFLAAYGQIIKGIVCALGIVVCGLGLAMVAMGDYFTGGVCTLIGGVVGVMAWGATGALTPGQALVAGFGGAMLAQAGQMLDAGNHKEKAPVAAQQ